jgi:hypothetical protein
MTSPTPTGPVFTDHPLVIDGEPVTIAAGATNRLDVEVLTQALQRNYCQKKVLPPAPDSPFAPNVQGWDGIYWITDTEGYRVTFADVEHLDKLAAIPDYQGNG